MVEKIFILHAAAIRQQLKKKRREIIFLIQTEDGERCLSARDKFRATELNENAPIPERSRTSISEENEIIMSVSLRKSPERLLDVRPRSYQ